MGAAESCIVIRQLSANHHKALPIKNQKWVKEGVGEGGREGGRASLYR